MAPIKHCFRPQNNIKKILCQITVTHTQHTENMPILCSIIQKKIFKFNRDLFFCQLKLHIAAVKEGRKKIILIKHA